MKKRLLLLIVFVGLSFYISQAQQLTDSNSALINNYFKTGDYSAQVVAETFLLQLGNYNDIGVQTDEKSLIQVGQIGDYNSYFFISAFGSKDFSIDVLQQGSGNSIQVFGENELMKNATIRQTGTDKQIIITNN